jgi:rSAM/selenodomain-associated transferase 1
VTGIATGDQTLFVARAAFAAAGGFPALPLMEDIALSKQLKRVVGRPVCLRQRVVTSGRRWDRHGAWRTVTRMWHLRFDYWRGVDPDILARRYGSAGPAAPVLQIFAKDPVPGTVKTRLGAAIGNAAAADLYRELAERTLATAVAAREAGIVGSVELWCDPDVERAAFLRWRDRFGITLRAQDGADLGQRMRHALATALARGGPALLVGTDSPAIDVAYLADAAAALASHDAVFGPADDGGYVLVGLARDVDAFSGIAWSTAGVMAATRSRLAREGVTWLELPALWDVDTPADLTRLRNWLARPVSAGP